MQMYLYSNSCIWNGVDYAILQLSDLLALAEVDKRLGAHESACFKTCA